MIRSGACCWALKPLLFSLLCLFIQNSNGKTSTYIPSLFDPNKNNPVMRSELYCETSSENCCWEATEHIKWCSTSRHYKSLQLDGPPNDRKFSSSVLFEFGVNGSASTEKFTSPPLEAPNGGAMCFTFRFFSMIDSKLQDGLHLYMTELPNNNVTEIWSRSNVDIDRWISEQVDVVTNSSFKLTFLASGEGGFASLQDFKQTPGFCKNRECDFEAGMCREWSMEGFQRTKASKSAFERKVDHTSRTGFGSFAYINFKDHIPDKENTVVIEGPEMKDLETQCFTFSFMRSGTDLDFALFVKNLTDNQYTALWRSNFLAAHIVNEWVTIRQTVKITNPVKLMLDVPGTTKSDSLLSVDDLSILPGECPKLVSCHFDENFCGWHANIKYSTHWSIGRGRVFDANKLISDKSFMTGSALLYSDFTKIDGPNPVTMELISESVEVDKNSKTGQCLTLDMDVMSIGDQDEVIIQQQTFDGNTSRIWRFKDTKLQVGDWNRQIQIYIPKSDSPYRLVLSATSKTPSTRIAIDSLEFSSDLYFCKEAKGIPTSATEMSPTPSVKKNPFIKLVCSFETETKTDCGWVPSKGENSFVVMNSFSATIPGKYLPRTDHTNYAATGGYTAAFNLKKSGNIDKATLTGQWPEEVSGSPICIDFAYYYYISGGGSGASLTVDNDKDFKTIWRAPPGISNQWHRVRFSFTPKDTKYISLNFRTTLVEGILGLDDINIDIGLCDESFKVSQLDFVCDFEDETTCDFNPLFVDDVDVLWKLYKGNDVIQNSDPNTDPHEKKTEPRMRDHTTGTQNGHFYGVSFSNPSKDLKVTTKNIVTQSKMLKITDSQIKCIRFAYYLEDINQNNTIFGYEVKQNILSDSHQQETLRKWQISGSSNRHWFTHHIPVTWAEDTVFTFNVQVKDLQTVIQKKSKIFIDDFTLSMNRCPQENCDFEDDSDCFLEPIPIGSNHMPPSIASVYVHTKIPSLYPTMYLNDFVEQYFHMFTPFQYKDLKLKKADGSMVGNFLLMTADDNYQRAIMVTDRFALSESERSICLGFSVNTPNRNTFLQIIVGDSYTGKNTLLHTIDGKSIEGWKKIEILAEPRNDDVFDMYFYIVGTIADKDGYIAIDEIRIKTFCDGIPANNVPNDLTSSTLSTGSTITTTESDILDPSKFKCENGDIIGIEKRCDWHSDCSDGSDEKKEICGDCDFRNHDMCGYKIVPQSEASMFGDFVWKLSNDDTSNDDKLNPPYLIAGNIHDVDFEKTSNDPLSAVIHSNVIHQSYSECALQFEYRRNGSKLFNNKFEVYIMNVGSDEKTLIWQSFMRPIDNMKWERVHVNLGRMTNPFLIGFSAEIADDDFESHSLNNIEMIQCGPPEEEKIEERCQMSDKFYCKNKVCLDIMRKCDLVDQCGDHSDESECNVDRLTNFAYGFDKWTPIPTDNEKEDGFFVISPLSFPDFRAGPLYDHTQGPTGRGGKLALFRPEKYDNNTKEMTATLASPYFRYDLGCQVRLFTFTNTLNSYITYHLYDISKPDADRRLSRVNLFRDEWMETKQDFTKSQSSNTIYRVVISATIASGFIDSKHPPYVGIDDITFSEQCNIVSKEDVEKLTTLKPIDEDDCPTLKCKNVKDIDICLEEEQLCDFYNHCMNGEDEEFCGNCKFDDDDQLCQWIVVNRKSVWKLQKPASQAANGLPEKDADSNDKGGYLYAWNPSDETDLNKLELAKIISPKINAETSETCMFRFSHRSFSSNTILRIGIKSEDINSNYNMLLYSDSSYDRNWKSYSVPIGARPKGLQIYVESMSQGRSGSVSNTFLDDFVLANCERNGNIGDRNMTCDFETSSCGWINVLKKGNLPSGTGQTNWVRLMSGTIEPGMDHTSLKEPLPDKYGTWLGFMTQEHTVAYLRTLVPLSENQEYCFSFWFYLMSYEYIEKITLYSLQSKDIESLDAAKRLMEIDNSNNREWLQKWVNIQADDKKRYLLFFVAISKNAFLGLDDFVLNQGNCSDFEEAGTCDFEMSQCAWKTPDGGWKRESDGRSHTTKDYNGHFMQLKAEIETEASMFLNLSEVSELAYIQTHPRTICISIYYKMKAKVENIAFVEDDTYVGIRALENGSILKSINVTATQAEVEDDWSTWSLMSFNFDASTKTTLEIFGQIQTEFSRLMIDDVTIYDRICQVNGNCDFEQTDLCGWTNQGLGGAVDFVRFNPMTKLKSPKFLEFDHTTKTSQGHYLLYPAFNGDVGPKIIKHPLIQTPSSTICLSLWYFAQTNNSDAIAIQLTMRPLSGKNAKIIDLNSTDFEWTEFKHTFKNVPHYITLDFKLNKFIRFTSDIGVDDISVVNGACNSEPPPTDIPQSESQLDCTMELGTVCNWNFTDWRVGNYNDQNDSYAPILDHTTGLAYGRYALAVHPEVDKSSIEPGSIEKTYLKSEITSKIQLKADKDRCLSFWYYEDSEWPMYLMINLVTDDSKLKYVSSHKSSIETRKKWNFLKVDIPKPDFSSDEYYGLNLAYCWESSENEIPHGMENLIKYAIDDLKLSPGLCGHQIDYIYDFENEYQELVFENIQPLRGQILSRRSNLLSNNIKIYPTFDHTFFTKFGYYLLFSPNNKVPYFKNTINLAGLDPDNSGTKCVRFAYQMAGNVTFKVFALGDIDDYDYDHSTEALYTLSNPTPKDMWTIAEFDKLIAFKHKVVFYMASKGILGNFFAMDDLVISNYQCQKPIDCNFENSHCSYTQMPFDEDSLSFARVTTPVKDKNWLGPELDHTTGSFGSGYIILSSFRTSKIQEAHRSRIVSGPRDVKIGSNYCLTMFTRLNTKDLSLSLSIVRLGNDYSEKNQIIDLFTLNNVEQKDWTTLNVNLNESVLGTANQIQLMIIGALSKKSKGAIAIDDVSVQDGLCPSGNNGNGDLVCEDGTPLNASQICNFIKDCPSGIDEASCGDCDFEQTTCGWKNVTNVPLASFVLVSAKKSGSILKAPKIDGSLNPNGHYLLFKIKGTVKMKSKAEMAVNYDRSMMKLKIVGETCVMSFDVFVQTSFHSHLEVKVGPSIDDVSTIYLLNIKSTNKKWHKVHVHLGHQWKPFIVDITANESPANVIAIDNVAFSNCSLPKPKSSCDGDEFHCKKYGLCISQDSVCDNINDCGDNSDEEQCSEMALQCNFESELQSCDIINESPKSQRTHWRLTSPRKTTPREVVSNYEPTIDNTLRSQSGNFLMLSPSIGVKKELNGTFSTKMMQSKPEGKCRMRFFYYIHDSISDVEKTTLHIQKRFASKTAPETTSLATISVTNELQQRWNKKVIELTDTSSFQILFFGDLGTKDARLAIDDITFDSGCLLSKEILVSTTALPSSLITDPIVTESTTVESETISTLTTPEQTLGDNSQASSGHGAMFAVGIAIPVCVVLIAVGRFIWFKNRTTNTDDRLSFSLNRLSKKYS